MGEDGTLRGQNRLFAGGTESPLHAGEHSCCSQCGLGGAFRTLRCTPIPHDRRRRVDISVSDNDLSRGIADVDAGNQAHSSRFRAW